MFVPSEQAIDQNRPEPDLVVFFILGMFVSSFAAGWGDFLYVFAALCGTKLGDRSYLVKMARHNMRNKSPLSDIKDTVAFFLGWRIVCYAIFLYFYNS